MEIRHNVTLNLHPIFIRLSRFIRAILDFGLQISDLLYRSALSLFIKLIRRRRTLNPNSKIQNPELHRILLNNHGKSRTRFKTSENSLYRDDQPMQPPLQGVYSLPGKLGTGSRHVPAGPGHDHRPITRIGARNASRHR